MRVIDGLTPFEAEHGTCFIGSGDLPFELVGESHDLLDQLRVVRQNAAPYINSILHADAHMTAHHDRHCRHTAVAPAFAQAKAGAAIASGLEGRDLVCVGTVRAPVNVAVM